MLQPWYKFSPHFKLEEFVREGEYPLPSTLLLVEEMCVKVLEPLRAAWGAVTITSGYRTPEHNKKVGGALNSWHVWRYEKCAVDVVVKDLNLAFSWMVKGGLPYDKIILESSGGVPRCIHIQYGNVLRQLAYLGPTHGQGVYTKVDDKWFESISSSVIRAEG